MKRRMVAVGLSCGIALALETGAVGDGEAEPESAEPVEAALLVDARAALGAMTALTEQHIRARTSALELAAAAEEVRSGDWERMKGLLAEAQQNGVPAAVWFARPDGSYFTVDGGLADGNLSDRPYFPKVLAGETCVAEPVVSRSTGRKSVVTAVPVRDGEAVIGVLGASIFLHDLSQVLKAELNLPKNMLFYALDSRGVTMVNWHPERIFLDPSEQGSASMAAATQQMIANERGEAEYMFNDRRRRVVFDSGPLTGWRFAVGVIEE